MVEDEGDSVLTSLKFKNLTPVREDRRACWTINRVDLPLVLESCKV